MRAGSFCEKGSEIPGRYDDETAGIEVARAERKHLPRIREMLDDIEENDDVQHPEFAQRAFVGDTGDHLQPPLLRMAGRFCGDLDSRDVEIGPCFEEKEPIG